MLAVTIKDARRRLNELVDAAERGEQVVLLRGSRHAAALVPITAADLELSPRLADDQAARLWAALDRERRDGRTRTFASADEAADHLASLRGTVRARPARRRR